MWRIVLIVLIFFAIMPKAFAGDRRVITGGPYFACISKEDVKKMISYATDGDNAALKSALLQGTAAGNCILLNNGDQVFLDKVEVFSGLSQVRLVGIPQACWVITEAIGR